MYLLCILFDFEVFLAKLTVFSGGNTVFAYCQGRTLKLEEFSE